MIPARQIMAVVAVTTALCAHPHALVAAPTIPAAPKQAPRQQPTRSAANLVTRLTEGLSRAVATTRVLSCEWRQDRPAATAPSAHVPPSARVVPAAHPPLSPFQFRLPPPAA